jgi:hypothetical protein
MIHLRSCHGEEEASDASACNNRHGHAFPCVNEAHVFVSHGVPLRILFARFPRVFHVKPERTSLCPVLKAAALIQGNHHPWVDFFPSLETDHFSGAKEAD